MFSYSALLVTTRTEYLCSNLLLVLSVFFVFNILSLFKRVHIGKIKQSFIFSIHVGTNNSFIIPLVTLEWRYFHNNLMSTEEHLVLTNRWKCFHPARQKKKKILFLMQPQKSDNFQLANTQTYQQMFQLFYLLRIWHIEVSRLFRTVFSTNKSFHR